MVPVAVKPHLEMNNEVLGLHVLHNVFLLMFQNGTAQIHLVVNAHHYTQTNILTDLIPVQVVPETLLQPMEANLKATKCVIL